MVLKNIYGDYKEAYKQVVPGTILCVDQLIDECINNPITENGGSLRRLDFFTADGEVYFRERGTPMLAITREATNPVLKNIDAAFDQLDKKGNYKISKADFAAVKNASDTVFVDLSQLRLLDSGRSCYYYLGFRSNDGYIFDGKDYVPANPEESKMMIRYGYTSEHLRLLSKGKKNEFQPIEETRIAVEKPDYVLKKAKTGPFGMASWLSSFENGLYFGAHIRDVHCEDFLRGVPLVNRAKRKGRKASPSVDEVLACFKKSYIHPADELRIRNLLLFRP